MLLSQQHSTIAARRSTLNPSAREWFPPGYVSHSGPSPAENIGSVAPEQQVNPDAVFLLSELPLEVRLVQGSEQGSLTPIGAEGCFSACDKLKVTSTHMHVACADSLQHCWVPGLAPGSVQLHPHQPAA
jgi:hypothetical protein